MGFATIMNMNTHLEDPMIRPPNVPSPSLRLESFKTFSRLQLIVEFQPWLEYSREHIRRRVGLPYMLLWDCLCYGAPLNTLLELTGSPTPRHLMISAEDFDFEGISIKQRLDFFASFIQRVHALEAQGRLSFGEVIRVDDFISGTNGGYLRILHTVNRVLLALQASYPGIYYLPHGAAARRLSLIQQLIESERVHKSRLAQTADSAAKLYEDPTVAHPSLEGFILKCSRLIPYHEHIFSALCETQKRKVPGGEEWDFIFAHHNKVFYSEMAVSYRSICSNYLIFKRFLSQLPCKNYQQADVDNILRNLSDIIIRFSEYCTYLQAILAVTSPSEKTSYDTLCSVIIGAQDLSESLTDVGRELRTMFCFSILSSRFGSQNNLLNDNRIPLGHILHDDCILVNPAIGQYYSVFVFEHRIFCCTDHRRGDLVDFGQTRYPLRPWEMGPALAHQHPLVVIFSIPTSNLKVLHCIDSSVFELTWEDKSECCLTFYPLTFRQYDQWISLLEPLVSRVTYSTSVTNYVQRDDGTSIYSASLRSIDEQSQHEKIRIVRKRTSSGVARPWSLIGRKGYRSENSSMINSEKGSSVDKVSILSPNMLPALFDDCDKPLSPLRLTFMGNGVNEKDDAGTPDAKHEIVESPIELISLPDLSEEVVKEGHYPVAHGGYSDIWKGIWKKDTGDVKVAIKVLRTTTGDFAQDKLHQKLHQELQIWRQLSHPNILELYGTVSSFGPSASMVCLWMKNGSLTKYLEKCSDILTTIDRLNLISEVASGLTYLHSFSVIHGDLTGSNILIDDELHARLCDFGLSSFLREESKDEGDSDTSLAHSVYTSHLGGSVRWADAHLFTGVEDDDTIPVVGKPSDIYSFGSVMLEILSGRLPYHYLRTDAQVVIQLHQGIKPRRPVSTFVDDDQWNLIQKCWQEPPENRPLAFEVLELTNKLLVPHHERNG